MLREGKEKSNQKVVTTPRPVVKAAPQTAKTETNVIDINEKLVNILSKIDDKLDILITNSTPKPQPKISLSVIKLSELKALRELANEAVMKNKYPGGDQNLMNECSILAFKIDEEIRNRLKIYQ